MYGERFEIVSEPFDEGIASPSALPAEGSGDPPTPDRNLGLGLKKRRTKDELNEQKCAHFHAGSAAQEGDKY
jgi:hypothetical protein